MAANYVVAMTEHDNGAIVTAFCDAWTNHDVEAIVAAFSDDAVYHNIPMDPIVGKAAVEATIRGFLGASKIAFETVHQVANGNVVMNERIDTVSPQEGATPDNTKVIPVMGVFVMRDGKIAEWRDYFDLATFRGA